jgi:hypothetical protein
MAAAVAEVVGSVAAGQTVRDAVALVAGARGVRRQALYQAVLAARSDR